MATISGYLTDDHKRCDDLFLAAETGVSENRWEDANAAMREFAAALEHHFEMEEQVLFPAFEEAMGTSAGPTSVMRMEHVQLRQIVAAMLESLEQGDANGFLGYADTLNTMMQQHNMKEESILYQMTDRVLAGRSEELVDAMRELNATT